MLLQVFKHKIKKHFGIASAKQMPDHALLLTYADILQRVRPFSMVHETGIVFSADAAVTAVKNNLPGLLVECGVWRGGCSMAMLLAQQQVFGRVIKPVYLLDSFEGLPPVGDKDGPLAQAWQNQAQPEKFLDNCTASVQQLQHDMGLFGFVEGRDFFIRKGWFQETVQPLAKQLAAQGQTISVLRLDGDWYDSTMQCLQALIPITDEGATVIIDDYYAWDGCARAVHDYLSQNDLPARIKSLPYNFGAYFIKLAARKSFEEF